MAAQQFLVLSSEISKPFIIPNVSPVSNSVSATPSRANSVSNDVQSRRPSQLL